MRTTATFTPGSYLRGRVVRCNRTLKHLFFTSGAHYWEVDVARMDKRASMVVGAVPSEGFDSETLNGPLTAWTDGAVGYVADGAIIQNGVELATHVEPFREGDVVGILLDLNARTIAFFLNGREVACVDNKSEKFPITGGLQKSSHPQRKRLLEPISFTPRAMFAAVTFAPDTDLFDIYSTPLPPAC